jgi:hypothetical protein
MLVSVLTNADQKTLEPLPPFPPTMQAAALPIVESVLFEIPIPPSPCGDEKIALQ